MAEPPITVPPGLPQLAQLRGVVGSVEAFFILWSARQRVSEISPRNGQQRDLF
jgi:hypothetical protein